MGRQVRRVPLDFDWSPNKVWEGFLMPDRFDEDDCPASCKGGYSWQYTRLHDLWYGYVPFNPSMTGSVPLTAATPAVRAFAERNVANAPDFYGSGERAIDREGWRLANMWNQQWCHHLSQVDVDALLAADRLWDFTREIIPGKGWQAKENPVHPTAAQVNEWNIRGFGHDSSNAWIVIRARCERYGMPAECPACDGHGGLEAYPGQRAEVEAWEPAEPPTGDGWQLWETVSEGSPISPVFRSPEELAYWMSSPAYVWGATKTDDDRPSYDAALRFVTAGWAPSFASSPQTGLVSGVEWVGQQEEQ